MSDISAAQFFQHPLGSIERLLEEVDEHSLSAFRDAVVQSLIQRIEQDQPIWLEGLGILASELRTSDRSRLEVAASAGVDSSQGDAGLHGGACVLTPMNVSVQSETTRRVVFEKCSELVSFHRERHPNIIETSQLAQDCHSKLPEVVKNRWDVRTTARHMRALWKLLKQQVVEDGFSSMLRPLGDFCSLHNRQGTSLSEWYAGADIFLVPNYRKVLHIGSVRTFPRPVLATSWELFEAAYGLAVDRFEINLTTELLALGFKGSGAEHRAALMNNKIWVSVFRIDSGISKDRQILIYVTEGVRRMRPSSWTAGVPAVEFVFQLDQPRTASHDSAAHAAPLRSSSLSLPLNSAQTLHKAEPSSLSVPRWPARVIAMSWMLMLNAGAAGVGAGAGFSCGSSIAGSASRASLPSKLSAIITTKLRGASLEQLSSDGPFQFMNVVGICDDEANIAEQHSSRHLLRLLRHRGLDQVSKPFRPSIADRMVVACRSLPALATTGVESFSAPADSAPADMASQALKADESLTQPMSSGPNILKTKQIVVAENHPPEDKLKKMALAPTEAALSSDSQTNGTHSSPNGHSAQV